MPALNSETAKIAWHELQKHYALGNVLAVAEGGDLIQVAIALHKITAAQIQQWLSEKVVLEVSDQQALAWYESQCHSLGTGNTAIYFGTGGQSIESSSIGN